jgi:hypothetical protein
MATSTAYRGDRLGARLVREVADQLRASGVEEITAPSALDDRVVGLLRQEGFAGRGNAQGCDPGALSLPL